MKNEITEVNEQGVSSSRMVNHILTGDALTMLKTLPDGFVHTCVTSPPYYRLRDYGVEGQIGLEETPAGYVEKLTQVFREVRRVLRNDGVLWLNLGDTYSDGTMGRKDAYQTINGRSMSKKMQSHTIKDRVTGGLGSKQLLGIPWRVAFALQADGWILRSDIIWNKPTAMPESVTDRPTKAHEYIFLFAKSERYYYDCDAIREPLRPKTFTTYGCRNTPGKGNDGLGKVKSDNWNSTVPEKKPKLAADGSLAGANKRTVWTVASQPFSEAHFATFPPKLIEPCILAGTSPRACEHCGSPWERAIVETGHINQRKIAAPDGARQSWPWPTFNLPALARMKVQENALFLTHSWALAPSPWSLSSTVAIISVSNLILNMSSWQRSVLRMSSKTCGLPLLLMS